MTNALNESIELLELRIFKAVDKPTEAEKFYQGQKKQLESRGVKGVKSATNTWKKNPAVYLMALYAGNKIVGGTRLHLNHKDYTYPFLEAVEKCDPALMAIMKRARNPHHAEGCGLWIEHRFSKYGLGEFLSRVLITTAHKLGLDHIYGICPRHTMDAFRQIGFHFHTFNDEVVGIPYPEDYISFLIQCEVSDLSYTFNSERKVIDEWLEDPFKNTVSKGSLGEIIIKLTGFPEAVKYVGEEKFVMPSIRTKSNVVQPSSSPRS